METPPTWRKRLPAIAGGIGTVGAVAGFAWLVSHFMASKGDEKPRVVQTVQMIRPPPPPPDEPPPPPPPEQPKEDIPQDVPEPSPSDEPAPSEQLGLDADGTAGSDGFGLAARKGGRDLAGSGGAAFAWYTGLLKDQVLDRLSGDSRVRAKKFSVTVRVWINPDGTVKNAQLAASSGSREVDAAIEAALASLGRLREGPPLEMPQPISLRVVSRS